MADPLKDFAGALGWRISVSFVVMVFVSLMAPEELRSSVWHAISKGDYAFRKAPKSACATLSLDNTSTGQESRIYSGAMMWSEEKGGDNLFYVRDVRNNGPWLDNSPAITVDSSGPRDLIRFHVPKDSLCLLIVPGDIKPRDSLPRLLVKSEARFIKEIYGAVGGIASGLVGLFMIPLTIQRKRFREDLTLADIPSDPVN
ncbi:MAG: hypothetical protein GY867_00100 [bacterium]|nr:hypothetical protein [bacterium]